jgi:cytidylate kinase
VPIIAVTKEMYSLGTSIGREVARQLGYELIRQDIIREAVREYHALEAKLVETVEEKPGFFEMLSETARRHHIFVAAEVFEFALRERVVIIGRWSALLLRGVGHAIRIRISAPLDIRVRRMMEQLNVGEPEARERIRRYDEGVRARIQQFFEMEWSNPLLYDLTINTGNVSVEAAAALIANLASAPEFQPTEASRRCLHDLALAAKVRATLKSHPETARLDVDVLASDGAITLRGSVPEAKHRQDIERIARTIPGVQGVESELIIIEERRAF